MFGRKKNDVQEWPQPDELKGAAREFKGGQA